MTEKEIKIELVTITTQPQFQALYDKAHGEENSLWYMNEGWYSPDETKHSWNTEKYIIWLCNINGVKQEAVGYFTITKYHQHKRATIHGLYVVPEYRKKAIPKHVLLFIGNKVFGELGYHSIEASAWSSNERIIKLYDSVMQRNGERKDYYYYNRKYHNKISWGLLYDESIYKGKTKLTMEELEEGLNQ